MSRNSLEWNEFESDRMGYYKHILSELLSRRVGSFNTFASCASFGGNTKEVQGGMAQNNGKECDRCINSLPPFAERISGLSEYDKDKLKHVLHEVVTLLNENIDKILGQILATSKVGSEKSLPSHVSRSFEDVGAPPCAKKQKADTFPALGTSEKYLGHPSSDIVGQVSIYIQAIEGSGEACQEAVKFSAGLLAKLGKMAQGVDDLLNKVASECRPMTAAEKHQLYMQIQKLPKKALDRVVEIVQMRRHSASRSSDKVSINFLELDDVTLWRLYYHMEVMLKANKT